MQTARHCHGRCPRGRRRPWTRYRHATLPALLLLALLLALLILVILPSLVSALQLLVIVMRLAMVQMHPCAAVLGSNPCGPTPTSSISKLQYMPSSWPTWPQSKSHATLPQATAQPRDCDINSDRKYSIVNCSPHVRPAAFSAYNKTLQLHSPDNTLNWSNFYLSSY